MVYSIIIRRKDKAGSVVFEYRASNLQNFDYNINLPISTFGLPEEFIESAIITKAEGNTGKLNFTWVVKDEATTPFTSITSWKDIWPDSAINAVPHTNNNTTDLYYSRKINTVGSTSVYQSFDLKTADGQVIALGELLEKRGFTGEERHEFILRNTTANYDIFFGIGLIQRIAFQKSAQDPVTWNVTIEFQIGDVVDSTDST
jgi:hypothetical protein